MKSITQEEPAGCGIACVAIVLNESYQSTKKLFDNPEYASTRGYYCRELIKVLNKKRKRQNNDRKLNRKNDQNRQESKPELLHNRRNSTLLNFLQPSKERPTKKFNFVAKKSIS